MTNGRASANIALTIADDATTEVDEFFTVRLSDPTTITTADARTTIAANDIAGTWAISHDPVDGNVSEGETVTYTVQYDGNDAAQGLPVSILVTVDLDTAADDDH